MDSPILPTETESRYYDSLRSTFDFVADKQQFLSFVSLLYDELTIANTDAKWSIGESVHGVLSKSDARNINWFTNSLEEVIDLYHYWKLYSDNPLTDV